MGLRIFSYLVVRLNLNFLKTSDISTIVFLLLLIFGLCLFEAKTKQQKLVICIFNL